MEMILSNDFCEIDQKECLDINGGNAEPLEVAEVVVGGVLVANSPVVAVVNPGAGVATLGLGLTMLADGYDAIQH
ncbi:hypothetical protein [Butyrivibrio sp. INlla21]|uniref:hypothetical protein n=1 Tax=Butyrivibrio sp. INlla21 TaxID=1520811 RepID=UPI0008F09235|nr:hypothetical protein [Butyrivibrio sp. INlla21]SFU83814.1 hypothetical protein SAMN02910342_01975 [Butyrivibrio sp. INlla21]